MKKPPRLPLKNVCWAAHPKFCLGYCTLKKGHTGKHQWER